MKSKVWEEEKKTVDRGGGWGGGGGGWGDNNALTLCLGIVDPVGRSDRYSSL